jgi:hypothetical protein
MMEMLARDKRSSLFRLFISYEEKSFVNTIPGEGMKHLSFNDPANFLIEFSKPFFEISFSKEFQKVIEER